MIVVPCPWRRFTAALRLIRPSVVRVYGGYWPSDLACRRRIPGVPVVVSVHDTNPALLRPSVREVDIVICMSQAVAGQVQAIGTSSEKIRILPNRVDRDIFCPIPDRQLLRRLFRQFPPGKHILHVGRKTEQKNLDTLVRALGMLPDEYSAIFVGRGDTSPYVSLAADMGVAHRCFWIQAIRNSRLPLWYSWCDCMCTPSRHEGFGIVFIEAAACGAAIVTSDVAPMNEYLPADQSACLVRKYEDAEELAQAIRRVCEDTEHRRLISEGAIEAARPFDRRIVDAAEVAIYREALGLA
jgi:glycosyltransferase involved in cell wall biosynthesis